MLIVLGILMDPLRNKRGHLGRSELFRNIIIVRDGRQLKKHPILCVGYVHTPFILLGNVEDLIHALVLLSELVWCNQFKLILVARHRLVQLLVFRPQRCRIGPQRRRGHTSPHIRVGHWLIRLG